MDYVSGTESSTAGSTSVSTPITDPCSDAFEQCLDPTLFGSESLEWPLCSSPEVSLDAKTSNSVGGIELALLGLESLLKYKTPHYLSEYSNCLGPGLSTCSLSPIQV